MHGYTQEWLYIAGYSKNATQIPVSQINHIPKYNQRMVFLIFTEHVWDKWNEYNVDSEKIQGFARLFIILEKFNSVKTELEQLSITTISYDNLTEKLYSLIHGAFVINRGIVTQQPSEVQGNLPKAETNAIWSILRKQRVKWLTLIAYI